MPQSNSWFPIAAASTPSAFRTSIDGAAAAQVRDDRPLHLVAPVQMQRGAGVSLLDRPDIGRQRGRAADRVALGPCRSGRLERAVEVVGRDDREPQRIAPGAKRRRQRRQVSRRRRPATPREPPRRPARGASPESAPPRAPGARRGPRCPQPHIPRPPPRARSPRALEHVRAANRVARGDPVDQELPDFTRALRHDGRIGDHAVSPAAALPVVVDREREGPVVRHRLAAERQVDDPLAERPCDVDRVLDPRHDVEVVARDGVDLQIGVAGGVDQGSPSGVVRWKYLAEYSRYSRSWRPLTRIVLSVLS